MKRIILHIICLLFLSISIYSQDKNVLGYRIEGNEVVFSFDKRDYDKATADIGWQRDFDDVNINEVSVSGEFNDWSMKKWRMTKIDENRYELRKKISDFSDEFTWEFKFVVNQFFWAEPSKKVTNSVDASKNGRDLGVYNLQMFTAFQDENGNLKFRLDGYQEATDVVVSGTFNLWDEHVFKMCKNDGGWELTLQVKPGSYEYKFIVDGEWVLDEENPNRRKNEFHGYNSYVDINAEATFLLKNYSYAEKVILVGSFNDWNENNYSMTKTRAGWIYKLKLSGGKHHYKFIVDGEWIVDPDNPVKEYDYDGNVNSVYMVK